MDVVYIADHRARARAHLLSQYADKPRMRALVDALADGCQRCEDEAFDLLVSTTLTAAQGKHLDQWGAIVGEARGGLVDQDYRRFIQARILVNNCEGTTDEVLAIWSLLTEPYVEIEHLNYAPATFYLRVLRDAYMSDARAARVGTTMRAVKPAGVAMMLVESVPGAFGFAEAAGAPTFTLPLDVGLLCRSL